MGIQLVKKGSEGIGLGSGSAGDPISGSVTLDDTGTPTAKSTSIFEFEVYGETYTYTSISLSVISEQSSSGLDIQLSLNNTNWFDSLSWADTTDAANGLIGTMTATGSDQSQSVYFKAVIDNDGSVSSGTYTTADVKLSATENQ